MSAGHKGRCVQPLGETPVSEVREAVGVSRATLYRYLEPRRPEPEGRVMSKAKLSRRKAEGSASSRINDRKAR